MLAENINRISARSAAACPPPAALAARPGRRLAPWAARPAGPGGGEAAAVLQAYLAKHYDDLVRNLCLRLGCEDLAREALHETWLRLERRARVPHVLPNPGGYLFKMALYCAVDKLRSEKSHGNIGVADEGAMLAAVDPIARVEDLVVCRAILDKLCDIIERLPRRRRAIFLAVRVEQLEKSEVAAMFGVTARWIDTELRKAEQFCGAALCLD
ncbi:RNA polymerase sigma factor [Pollutimonas bauzanensis]|uniref:RNA polymerase sigma-70 factor, ECF subfamily n=1 Tax=Pollutimonas bauzanensis TaxID=658167 RepID=A0A1M5ZZF3_9BURK|nr:RNA polymerase sigma factor [Pollutimonas bauzanensis]SHI29610.1 RNA polymerase sigma-70 factor, ECF subfamily [Pollutimonas bauzanensis]